MSSIAMSAILYAALHSGQSCESVFFHTAQAANSGKMNAEEKAQLSDMAHAACQSSNPDVIWQIAQTESNFRFLIVRDNQLKKARIFRGKQALTHITRLPQSAVNVDVGVLQLNWAWHRKHFRDDPQRMLSAAEQVNYLIEHYGDAMFKRCSSAWVGCYHSPANRKAARRYEKIVRKNGVLLGKLSLRYAVETRQDMNAEQRADLPPLKAEEVARVLRRGQPMSFPVRDFYSVAHALQLEAVKIAYQMGISS